MTTPHSPVPLGTSPSVARGSARAIARAAGVVIAVLAFLPIANWIPGGHQADWYSTVSGEWVYGSAIVVGGALILTILSRRLPIWRDGMFASLAKRAHSAPTVTGLVIAAFALALYAIIALHVLSGHPLFIDEISQLFQARVFASGRPWLDAPTHPEFTSILHVVDSRGKWFSQFPPGGPLMMVPGVLLHAPWITGPVAGAVTAALFWGVVRRIEPRATVSLGASLLMAFAPFVAFLAASYMNHVTAGMWVMLAIYALTRMSEPNQRNETDDGRPTFAALAGFSFGVAASIRPVDAFAFALPAGIWMIVRVVRQPRRFPELLAAGLALAIPVGMLLWFNAQTTGSPFLFAYEQLWGRDHGLGFHRAPYGFVHTPARGLELLNLYFLRLQSYLFETPIPSLLPVIGALALTRRLDRIDRYLFASVAFLLLLYFAYWHDGFYLGPRFVYLTAPFLVLWAARFPSLLRERWPNNLQLYRATVHGVVVAIVIAVGASIPYRAAQYQHGLRSMRVDFPAIARRAGVENALIFVRESWGSQLMSRMWALGVPHSEAESLYRNVDACALENVISSLEQTEMRDSVALRALLPLLADSSRVVRSTLSPDQSERQLPGRPYEPRCQRRILDDREGFTLLAPLMASEWGSNVYARDLHARDSLLVQRYPTRSLYLLRPVSSDESAPLQLTPLRIDSLRATWARSTEQ